MSRLARIPSVLFVVAVPLLLVTGSVAWAVNDLALYNRGFQKYNISQSTGITDAQLRQAGGQIRRYFNSREEPLALRSRIFGVDKELFNEREVQHMADVKRLVRGVYAVSVGAGAYLLAMAAAGFLFQGRRFRAALARLCLWGGGVTLALVLGVALLGLVGFDSLFLAFHRLSFRNDLWQLDPRTDYLIMLFPEDFWFDATLFVGALAVSGAALLTALSGGYLLYRRKRDRRSSGARPTQLKEIS